MEDSSAGKVAALLKGYRAGELLLIDAELVVYVIEVKTVARLS